MAHPFQQIDFRSRNALAELLGVAHMNKTVLGPPQNQCRYRLKSLTLSP